MLAGIRVLDLTQYLSGPTATLLLAGLGADVIKVELGPGGDPSRDLPVIVEGRSSYYVQQNRGKRSVCVDFSSPDGIAIVADLAAAADVMIENLGPGVLARRGLDYATLSARNPGLVMATISAFGRSESSLSHLPGYDLIGQAYAGSVALTGDPDGPPVAAGAAISDCSSGILAFGAIGHALFNRERTGQGDYIDISMVEPVFLMHPFAIQGPSVTEGKLRLRRNGRHFGAVPPAGTYRGPEGWLVLQVLAPQWGRLCEATAAAGNPPLDLAADERFTTVEGRAAHRGELVDVLERWMQTFPTDAALLEHLGSFRLPAAPVVDPADAENYPWFRERGALATVDDPVIGPISVPGFPIHLASQPRRATEPQAPCLGEHNESVLRDVLGYDDARIAALTNAGVLFSRAT